METLGDALPKEMARVREVMGYYKEIGMAGVFGLMMIEQSLRRADAAILSGDVAEMIKAYEDLKSIKE
jgi:hypothetical protein